MARHLICIIHGVGKHDSNKRKERLQEMVKNKDLLLPRVGGDVDFEFRFTEWHRCPGARDVSIFHHLSFLCLLPLPPLACHSVECWAFLRATCGAGFGALVRGEREQVREIEQVREREQGRERACVSERERARESERAR